MMDKIGNREAIRRLHRCHDLYMDERWEEFVKQIKIFWMSLGPELRETALLHLEEVRESKEGAPDMIDEFWELMHPELDPETEEALNASMDLLSAIMDTLVGDVIPWR